jgi:CrcB protein
MWRTCAGVAAGGLVGAMAREGVTVLFGLTRLDTTRFPVPTLVVNFVGALLLGFLSERLSKTGPWYYALCTGLCGGLTTFSTFCDELHLLIKKDFLIEAAVYAVGSVGGGALLAFLGTLIYEPSKKTVDVTGTTTSITDWEKAQTQTLETSLIGE